MQQPPLLSLFGFYGSFHSKQLIFFFISLYFSYIIIIESIHCHYIEFTKFTEEE